MPTAEVAIHAPHRPESYSTSHAPSPDRRAPSPASNTTNLHLSRPRIAEGYQDPLSDEHRQNEQLPSVRVHPSGRASALLGPDVPRLRAASCPSSLAQIVQSACRDTHRMPIVVGEAGKLKPRAMMVLTQAAQRVPARAIAKRARSDHMCNVRLNPGARGARRVSHCTCGRVYATPDTSVRPPDPTSNINKQYKKRTRSTCMNIDN